MAKEKNEGLYTTGKDLSDYQLPDDNVLIRSISGDTHRSVAESVARIKLKSGHNRNDVDFHRPEDAIPNTHEAIIEACQAIYKKIGIIRNVIDLMSDFAAGGLSIQHSVKGQERFFKKWAEKVDLANRAHDFMKLFMRDGNIIIKRKLAIITKPALKDMMKADMYDPSNLPVDEDHKLDQPLKIKKEKKNINKREIPWSYTFLSPLLVQKVGGSIGKFFGTESIAFKIPKELAQSIKNPKTAVEKDLIKKLPAEVLNSVNSSNNNSVLLDPSTIYLDYYKKDDWESWGTPFLYGILEDVLFKEKMRLADMAALDGVINVVRLWKLGRSDKDILPTKTGVNKLLDLLSHNVGGGIMDIVWDDMIDYKVEYPPTDKILGADKYKSVNSDIIKGLGIPDALIGGGDSTTRNGQTAFVQLKTLVERLEYVRGRCIRWIQSELKMVADAFGFKEIPNISFGIMSLRDEAAEKQLIIQLLDRNIISVETACQIFGQDFMIELGHMKEEDKIRESNPPMLEKANPYYRPNSQMELQQKFAVDLQDKKLGLNGGDNLSGDQPRSVDTKEAGRPNNTIDTKKRDERTNRILSVYKTVGEKIFDNLDEIIDKMFLESNGVKNIRSLTKDQKISLENIKICIFPQIDTKDNLDENLIINCINKPNENIVKNFCGIFTSLLTDYQKINNCIPDIKEKKSLMCSSWSILKTS